VNDLYPPDGQGSEMKAVHAELAKLSLYLAPVPDCCFGFSFTVCQRSDQKGVPLHGTAKVSGHDHEQLRGNHRAAIWN
jgi:hypothetical protein